MAAIISSDAAGIEHHAGRPLDASRDDALRASALELLADIGYDRLTIDKIAAHAGAGKATIYRRWSGKAELVVDALMCQKVIPSPPTLDPSVETSPISSIRPRSTTVVWTLKS